MGLVASLNKLAPILESLSDADKTLLGQALHARRLSYTHPPDAAANTATTALGNAAGDACSVVTGKLLPAGACTFHAANYATITVGVNNGAGGGVTTIATLKTDAASWVAGTAIALSLTSAAVTAAQYLHVAIAKSGTGVALPAFRVVLDAMRTA